MHKACKLAGYYISAPILSTSKGVPFSTENLRFSLSHKNDHVVALVSNDTEWQIGIDIEMDSKNAVSLSQKILNKSEIILLKKNNIYDDIHVLLLFSLKESIYKAISPLLTKTIPLKKISVDIFSKQKPISAYYSFENRKLRVLYDWRLSKNCIISMAKAKIE